VRLFFFLPVRGIWLAWGTIVFTVVYAVYLGWEHYVPALVAMAAMLVWIFRRWLRKRWTSYKRARSAQKAANARRRADDAAAAIVRNLEVLDEEAPPPMPAELEEMLGRIVEETSREQKAGRAKNRR